MRTMACVWFSVIVLISMQEVFGNVCQKENHEYNCDECIRCNGNWCRKPESSSHCSFSSKDEWCPYHQEYPTVKEVAPDHNASGIFYAERNLLIDKPSEIIVSYFAKDTHELEMMIMNTTQTYNIELTKNSKQCSGSLCTTSIVATASNDFCKATGNVTEYVDVKIYLDSKDVAHIKFYVTCACACSLEIVKSSSDCNYHGDFSCGVCTCHPGWTGEYCKQPIKKCEEKRGDVVQCSLNSRNDEDCSGNGYCGICETCICYTDREGSQYFDQENNCAGLCNVASECEDCLVNNTIGECSRCIHPMTLQRYNESLTREKDAQGRKIWVKCNETIDDCGRLEYFATRDTNGDIYVMMLNHCNEVEVGAYVGETNVSMILGILGLVAVVAAVGGIMLWKHMNTVPPVPLNDPQYQNIDAEDCTGENPLYKPPTSSFKNPTYGKW